MLGGVYRTGLRQNRTLALTSRWISKSSEVNNSETLVKQAAAATNPAANDKNAIKNKKSFRYVTYFYRDFNWLIPIKRLLSPRVPKRYRTPHSQFLFRLMGMFIIRMAPMEFTPRISIYEAPLWKRFPSQSVICCFATWPSSWIDLWEFWVVYSPWRIIILRLGHFSMICPLTDLCLNL